MDHEVVPCQRAFHDGHNYVVRFLKNTFWKSLCPWLGVDQIKHGPREVIMHQKVNVLMFLRYIRKWHMWKNFSCLTSPLLPFFPCSYENFRPKGKKEQSKQQTWKWHLFCRSHRKTCWTMIVDNARPQVGDFGDFKFHDHSYIFLLLDVNRSGPGMSSTTHQRRETTSVSE